jgi:hypothetical protein
MANIPSNSTAVKATTSITGSYAGFTVATSTISFTALVDANGNNLGALTFPAGTTVPLFVTSASFTGGPAIFYT